MSRTRKDKPNKLKYEAWDKDRVKIEGFWGYIWLPTTKTKKRKEVDTEEHWMGTPSWWTRIMMNRPMRARGKQWEKLVLKELDIEDTDPPGVGKKPHVYYW